MPTPIRWKEWAGRYDMAEVDAWLAAGHVALVPRLVKRIGQRDDDGRYLLAATTDVFRAAVTALGGDLRTLDPSRLGVNIDGAFLLRARELALVSAAATA